MTVLIFSMASAYGLVRSTSIPFGYAGTNCYRQPLWLPGLTTYKPSDTITAQPVNMVSIFGYSIYSHHTCLTLRTAGNSNGTSSSTTLQLRIRGFKPAVKRLHIALESMPALTSQSSITGPVATSGSLDFQLDKSDNTFIYRLTAASRTTDCQRQSQTLRCDLRQLQLAQASRYDFALRRYFGNQALDNLYTGNLATVQTVAVTASSIAGGQIVYDKPSEITLTLNRPAVGLKTFNLLAASGGNQQAIPHTTEFQGSRLIVRFNQPLPRASDIVLRAGNINAADGGFLAAPYELRFKTSGGPKVQGINIGSYNVAPGTTARLSFDSPVKVSQPLNDIIRLEANGQQLPATVTVAGSRVSITPKQPLASCTNFTVKVLDNLLSSYDISGGSQWQFQSRSTCQSIFSIGTSVQGRSITAFRFGGGASRIVYVGGTHGNERSSVNLLQRWIDHLEANPSLIPAGRAITIIPLLNPDGYAADRRTNARNVDLNRNFPSNNWKKSVIMPDKSTNASGGGSAPLSEPESAALANYITSQNPRLVLTYHATGNVVIPNDAGDSVNQARAYADRSSVYFAANASTATLFEYDTTGAFEDWLHDKRGTAGLLVELNSMSGNEFSGHINALRSSAGQ